MICDIRLMFISGRAHIQNIRTFNLKFNYLFDEGTTILKKINK